MLTESSLKKHNNNNSHLISSIYGISAYNSILNCCIFNRDNFSLNPAQCELLKWHSQWCHCDLNQVRMIFSLNQDNQKLCQNWWTNTPNGFTVHNWNNYLHPLLLQGMSIWKQKQRNPETSKETKDIKPEGVLTAGADLISTLCIALASSCKEQRRPLALCRWIFNEYAQSSSNLQRSYLSS